MRPSLFLITLAIGLDAQAACEPSADVLLNEIVMDPSGADADAEWVELYNRGTAPVLLDGWVIERAKSPGDYDAIFEVPDGFTLQPGGYLVVSGLLAVLPDDVDYVGVPQLVDGMGNASSNSDAVRLVDCEATVRDVVVYGTENAEDQAFENEEGELVVDLKLAPKATSGKSIARVPDGADTNNGVADFAVLSPATPGVSNGTTAGPVTCDGAGVRGSVLINEFFANPGPGTNPEGSTDSGYEWVELFNASSDPVDLSGWQIQQASVPEHWGERIKATLPELILQPGELVLVAEDLVIAPPEANVVVLPEGARLSLGNSQDGLRLTDCTGAEIDTVLYGGGNPDGFLDDDEVPIHDDDIAGSVEEDRSLARRSDGHNTGVWADDFVTAELITPGLPNLDLRCKGSAGTIVINELFANPSGADGEARSEWVELYNAGEEPVDISTWTLERAGTYGTSGELNRSLLHGVLLETILQPKEYFLIGGELAEEADQRAEDFDAFSGSGGDLVILFDCYGERADSVLYGGDNEDGLPEDDGFFPERGAPKPGDDQCISRLEDGLDTNNSYSDFVATSFCTPGAENAFPTGSGNNDPIGGCSSGPSNGQPRAVAPRSATPGEGCSMSPGRHAPFWMLLMIAGLRRRRD